MRTVDLIKQHIPTVLNYYQLPPITGKQHFKGKCPICGRRGKFRIDNRDNTGSWICCCGSGNIWKLLQQTQNKDFPELAKEIDKLLGNTHDTPPKRIVQATDKCSLRQRVYQKFIGLREVKDTHAESYFKFRHIDVLPTQSVRYSENERYGLGAIYAMATDAQGHVCYLHRTFLAGDKKAAIAVPKLMTSLQEEAYLEFAQSIAIRLFPLASTLGVAEGMETALSCHQIYKCSVWSTMNATLMKKFRAPMGVNHLIVFADSDENGTGLAAAFECANRNLLSNNDVEKVTVRWPKKGDFNDLFEHCCEVYEWSLARKKVA